MKRILLATSVAAFALAASAGLAAARDQIQIAGSSTVLPYAKIVAEQFGETFTNFKTPVVESGGSGAGIKEFCKGVGEDTIDIANSSRSIKKDEVKSCVDAGVKEIQEVKIGYDGIVFATDIAGPDWALSPRTCTTRWPPSWSSTASWSTIRTPSGARSIRSSPTGTSLPTSPAKSTARAKCSSRSCSRPAATRTP